MIPIIYLIIKEENEIVNLIFILKYAERSSNYSKSISNMHESCREIGEKTCVATRGGGEKKHDFSEKYTPLPKA